MGLIAKLLRKDGQQTRQRTNKGSVTVKLTGPGVFPETFTLRTGNTLNLNVNWIDCSNGGSCETKTPESYKYEVISID